MQRLAVLVSTLLLVTTAHAGFSPELVRALDEAKYVYVQSERKSGALGAPAEIWFFREGDAIYVGTRPTSWRVRRAKAGRARARVAVGRPDGPSFDAKAALVNDAKVAERLCSAYAHKYSDAWSKYEQQFRDGFKDGSRVLVRYTPAP